MSPPKADETIIKLVGGGGGIEAASCMSIAQKV